MKRVSRATLRGLARELESGRTTARLLAEQSLSAIADPAGEGARAFVHVNVAQVRATADAQDVLRQKGMAPSPYAGIPLAIKDLFDVKGEVTTAGSTLLSNAVPADKDCDAVAQMRTAGFVPLGRTNMTEFAYSGLGLNPHYGTPLSVYGRKERRIPGGSSSGSAVAVADGMCVIALGTDTGGSCRIPAAFNGIVGFKPSAQRVSKRGVYPLSGSFDSIGPLANSVECCAIVDGLLSGQGALRPSARTGKLRIGVLQDYVLDGLDQCVAGDFAASLTRLAAAGHHLADFRFPQATEMPSLLTHGGIVAAEAWAHHKPMIEASESLYDPRVSSRIRFGALVTAPELARIRARRAEMASAFVAAAAEWDAVICPTVAIIPPCINDLTEENDYRHTNSVCLRNTYLFNFLDGCSISLPMHLQGGPPTGLMLSLPNGRDKDLFAVALSIETVI